MIIKPWEQSLNEKAISAPITQAQIVEHMRREIAEYRAYHASFRGLIVRYLDDSRMVDVRVSESLDKKECEQLASIAWQQVRRMV